MIASILLAILPTVGKLVDLGFGSEIGKFLSLEEDRGREKPLAYLSRKAPLTYEKAMNRLTLITVKLGKWDTINYETPSEDNRKDPSADGRCRCRSLSL